MTEFKEEIKKDKTNYLSIFIKCISKIHEIKNFDLIGEKIIDTEDGQLSFEIYCRYSKSDHSEEDLHFLINDVSRVKIKEKINAEYRYKTVFLSKVAHEIKNPLVSISELISQINDKINKIEDEFIIDNFNQIKIISDYLLILIKDLDYFSEQIEKKDFLVKQKIKLKEIVEFCEKITNSLIRKTNKSDLIHFNTIVEDNVALELMTDPTRLKQILVNLLSNSVKFTNFGNISLVISLEKRKEKEMIIFLVKDSGTGINEELKQKLFLHYSKGFDDSDNIFASGLGLFIANDIAKKLGEQISFSSELGRGSSFWFYIDSDNLNESKINYISNDFIKNEEKNNNIISVKENLKLSQSSTPATKNEEFNPNKLNLTPIQKFNSYNNEEDKELIDVNNNLENLKSDISENNSPEIKIKNKFQKVENKNINFDASINISKNSITPDGKYQFNISHFILNDLKIMRENDSSINVLVIDDEVMTRKATIRTIHLISNEIGIKINIIEAEDGVESIYLIYKSSIMGIKISIIFSDENMNFMSGSKSSEMIYDLLKKKNLKDIPFYLVTAYDCKLIEKYVGPYIKMILSKPLCKDNVRKIISELIKS